MCVYNGGRYLRAQLDSIAAQSELPRCMAIVDDGSTDGSWELLQEWAVGAPFRVLLQRNEGNLGVVRNFEKAARLLLGEVDVVFFSDHDDVWFPEKLATVVDAFEADPSLGLVHSDATLIDSDGQPLGRRLFASLLVTSKERELVASGQAYLAYVKRNLVTGAACASSVHALALAMPFSERWIHDEWIALTCAFASRVRMLDTPLMEYRLHATNTVGLPIPTWGWRARSVLRAVTEPQVAAQQRRLERLLEIREHAARLDAPQDALVCIDSAIRHARHRANLPRAFLRRLFAVRREWSAGRYDQWSSGDLSMLHDLLIAT
ncbi:glycosyltransferase family 2 protein [Ramlibacter ginsenosidimutans]|uniref:Glycosyltransferase family 2 protein n=1 Tax=Ramlibacter ginsenosidimutans TaxID=502333 RepID=A0A934TQ55_9BURK|nr:glycosyltransferase family 2 protein [Ramlibacter ginsenosidimutans]MBK6004582.1 glycosyltransferase family 2 protein [Ramlibacter ginsenosidimutans]